MKNFCISSIPSKMPRFDLASFNKRKRQLREEVLKKTRGIKDLDDSVKKKSEELDRMVHKHQRLDDKVNKTQCFLCKEFVFVMCNDIKRTEDY